MAIDVSFNVQAFSQTSLVRYHWESREPIWVVSERCLSPLLLMLWLIDWLMDWYDWLTDWLTDWFIHWLCYGKWWQQTKSDVIGWIKTRSSCRCRSTESCVNLRCTLFVNDRIYLILYNACQYCVRYWGGRNMYRCLPTKACEHSAVLWERSVQSCILTGSIATMQPGHQLITVLCL